MDIQKHIRSLADKETARHSARFFKTNKGEYAHGDLFLGIRMPVLRKIAKQHCEIDLKTTIKLVKSKYHEERMLGLLIISDKYSNSKIDTDKEKLYNLYVKHFKYVNNWDLVDVTCPHVVGKHLIDKDRSILKKWAKSDHLWTRRISMVSNWWFIRNNDTKDVFIIAKILLNDEHDLIHKAVGWMLREAGKKDLVKLEKFLKSHYNKMPRTMLRYAIEKFPEAKRKRYLNALIL
jgi:3-methyladenine DNA glycosylase AlkD